MVFTLISFRQITKIKKKKFSKYRQYFRRYFWRFYRRNLDANHFVTRPKPPVMWRKTVMWRSLCV